MVTVTSEQLVEALTYAVERAHEFDNVDDKLAVFGLNAAAVTALLQQRWLMYRDEYEDSTEGHVVFVRGFVEGLFTGLQLAQCRHE